MNAHCLVQIAACSIRRIIPAHAMAAVAVALASSAPIHAHAESTLKPGDAVDIKLLAGCKALQGEIPQTWEPGKVYLLELWASWCDPCVQSLPRVNAWHMKYREEGLRVVGVDVWDEFDKAAALVHSKESVMTYPVAFAPRDGDFDTKVLKAAGVRGIPTVLALKDGKLLFATFPGIPLETSVIQDLLAGGAKEQEAVKRMVEKARRLWASEEGGKGEGVPANTEIPASALETEVRAYIASKDFGRALKAIDGEIGKVDAASDEHLQLLGLKIGVYVEAKDETKALGVLDEVVKTHPDTPMAMAAPMIATKLKQQISGKQ